MNLPSLFDDEESYQKAFIDGLKDMLKHSEELGVFILVLANATYDNDIYELFRSELKLKFKFFEQLFSSSDNDSSLGAPDDVVVFKQLMDIGFDNCGLNQVRKEGHWTLQFNPLRSLRPARNSQAKVIDTNQMFDVEGFNFNKPFLVKEELWQGHISKRNCRVLYNKFPFADFHSLLVIDSQSNKNQWISNDDLEFLWQISQSMEDFDSLQIAYNSMGAYASINHQHFQLSINSKSIIQDKKWIHNGGYLEYPLTCLVVNNNAQAWLIINDLQTRNIAFNFLLKYEAIYIVPRFKQGEYCQDDWTVGFGWAETFGLFSITKSTEYQSLTSKKLEQELGKLKI